MIGAFLLGVLVGGVVLALFFAFSLGDKPAVTMPPARGTSALQIHLSSSYITQLVNKDIQSSSSLGKVSNIQVHLAHNQITVTGEDQVTVLGFSITKPFTMILQPVIQSCMPQVHILHADIGGLRVTGLTASLQDRLNQQLQSDISHLPSGFTYCATSLQTESGTMVVDFSATPQA
jgi:hypothetical protein